ncbi:MAG: glutamyl-tRNA reductase [Pseudonocardiales bacterium]|nr:MAG: glutamyl-tRNA reductase [Pseudonocardiales bacterium]
MSLLVVGLSHRTASVPLLERTAVAGPDLAAVLAALVAGPDVAEALVLSTCNRVELYAEVDKFHSGVKDLSALLAQRAGVDVAALGEHLYVHYDDAAVQHLFTVAAGLDSMVVGEAQILGQLRTAYAAAQAAGTIGRHLHGLSQQALRVGKRVHTETQIDAASSSLVTVGVAEAGAAAGGLAGRSVLVCGAGATAALVVATLQRAGVTTFLIANRTPEPAAALAATVGGRPVALGTVEDALAKVDIVVSATAATGIVLHGDVIERVMKLREGRPLVALDLALPRDIDPQAGDLPEVTLIDLEHLRGAAARREIGTQAALAGTIVAAELGTFLANRRSLAVAPTVAALRSRAADLVDAELARLAGRLPRLDAAAHAEVGLALRRVVAALLHTPTVRVKELATAPGGETYAAALRELFELDPEATAAVTRALVIIEEESS